MNRTIHKIIVICTVILIVFIISRIDCIILRLNGVPDSMKENTNGSKRWLFLYGGNICATCSIGEFILKNANDAGISFVLPSEYSEIDRENFKRSYSVKSDVFIAYKEIERFYKVACRCLMKKTSRMNILIEVSPKGRVMLSKII